MPKIYDKLMDSMIDADDIEGSTPADVNALIKFMEKPENAAKVDLIKKEREQVYGTTEEKSNERITQ